MAFCSPWDIEYCRALKGDHDDDDDDVDDGIVNDGGDDDDDDYDGNNIVWVLSNV